MSKNDYSYEQPELFEQEEIAELEVCLGMHFNSTEERREYFRNLLRDKLKDPEFRKIEGFPIGEDEDIIALSDPPYYCACPNPWMPDFVAYWKSQKNQDSDLYKRDPFASDVSEGKNDKIYESHTYHTKVPHKAIMRYILHYTNPGDIVYDGFCGSGMTGVAAFMCGDRTQVESLGYKVTNNDIVHTGEVKTKLGARKAILNDLSPIASNIAYNFNSPVNLSQYKEKAQRIYDEVFKEYGWMFKTKSNDGREALINYTVWSDVFICPECGNEIVYMKAAVKQGEGRVLKEFPCPYCQAKVNKSILARATITKYDSAVKENVTLTKQVPILINYSIDKERGIKEPDFDDWELIKRLEDIEIPHWYPIDELPNGVKTVEPKRTCGIRYIHQFYTKRNLIVLSALWAKSDVKSRFGITNFLSRNLTKLNRFVVNSHNPNGRINGPLSGTLYIPSEQVEQSAFQLYKEKMLEVGWKTNGNAIAVNSSTHINLPSNSIDYIFLDPPFGANLMYSELSYIWESWLKVKTDNTEEAIENEVQKKGIFEYYSLMKQCFAEAFRVLKPGHWMTVEFSNTKGAIWNSIQTSLSDVGFIVANVSVLDKKHGGIKAMFNKTSVKQDLVISLYKPDENFEKQVVSAVGVEAVWNFVRRHLSYLPLVKKQGESVITVPERDPRIIYDRMVSYFVGHNMLIPIDSPDFLAEMPKRFAERNGLYYLEDQVQEYDKLVAKQQIKALDNESMDLFVTDETSAINWVRAQLKNKPMTLGEMTPLFMQQLDSWNKNEKRLELRDILEQNFLCYDAKEEVPSFIHGWLSTMYKDLRNLSKSDKALQEKAKGRWYVPDPNKASDLEKIRDKALLKEFELYKQSKGKLKEFRIEAIRVGFKKAWQEKDYQLIKSIAERMPQSVIEEDEKLLMWYNMAVSRLG